MSSLRRFTPILLLFCLLGCGGIVQPAVQDEQEELALASRSKPCTVGDAQAMFQALEVAWEVMVMRGINRPKLVDSIDRCQYRVFFDGRTFTFSEDDVFLGGVIWFSSYEQFGITRQEAIAEIEAIQDRVWLAEVLPDGTTGELVEQPLMRTSYKNVIHTQHGLTVFQHRAFITQLPPGEYVSIWESRYFDSMLTATVHLVILPRD